MKNNEWQIWLPHSWLFCLKGLCSFRNFAGIPKPQNWRNLDNSDTAPVWVICVMSPSPPHLITDPLDVSDIVFPVLGRDQKLIQSRADFRKVSGLPKIILQLQQLLKTQNISGCCKNLHQKRKAHWLMVILYLSILF